MGRGNVQSWRSPKRQLLVSLAGTRAGYNCSSCKKAGLCEVRGCLPGTKAATPYIINGEEIWKCPLTFVNAEVNQAILLWTAYRKGFLPDEGAFLDQSNRFVEYIELLESDQNQYEQEEMEREKSKAKRMRR